MVNGAKRNCESKVHSHGTIVNTTANAILVEELVLHPLCEGLLLLAYVVCGKVIFSVLSVSLSIHIKLRQRSKEIFAFACAVARSKCTVIPCSH